MMKQAFVYACILFLIFGWNNSQAQIKLAVSEELPEGLVMSIDQSDLGRKNLEYKLAPGNEIIIDIEEDRFAMLNNGVVTTWFYIDGKSDLALNQAISEAGDAPTYSLEGESDLMKKYNDFFLHGSEYYDQIGLLASMNDLSIDQFEIWLFGKRREQISYLNSDESGFAKNTSEQSRLRNWIDYNYFNLLLEYSLSKAPTRGFYELPAVILNDMAAYIKSSPKLLELDPYKSFVINLMEYKALSELEGNTKNKSANFLSASVLAEKNFEAEVLHYHQAELLRNRYKDAGPSVVKNIYTRFSASPHWQTYDDIVLEASGEWMETKEKKVKTKADKKQKDNGQIAKSDQPFKLVDLNGKEVYMSDFKGKVVYIDFWASWCGPCRRQFPYAKKLKHKFTEKELKQIVFLYISIDSSIAAWKKGIKDNKLEEGTNVFSPGGWGASVVKHYGISSIPRYMMMNKKGEIVNSNAARPQQMPMIYNELLRLIKE